VKLVDFGVARFLDRVADDTVAGTPAYMPPEQWTGEIEPRSDVYALGALLYELLVGEAPFTGSLAAVMSQHTDCLPAPPSARRPGILPELEALVLRMLAKDPGMRPRAAEVARALTELAYGLPPGARIVTADAIAS
jgi:serine/threonine protein kinase